MGIIQTDKSLQPVPLSCLSFPPPNNGEVPVPAIPANPPTLADITNAQKYAERLRDEYSAADIPSRSPEDATDDCVDLAETTKVTGQDVTRAQVYVHRVIDKHVRQDQVQLDRDDIREIINEALLPLKRQLDDNNRLIIRVRCLRI